MTLFIAEAAIAGGVRDTLQFNQASCEGVNIWGWRAMWVIIDYKSQFEAETTVSKKRWGNNPRLQCWVAAALLLCLISTAPRTAMPPNDPYSEVLKQLLHLQAWVSATLTSNIHPK